MITKHLSSCIGYKLTKTVMKHFLITIFLTLSISCSTYAQHAIYYGYDAAGNRIYRELRSQPRKGMRKQMDGDTLNINGNNIRIRLDASRQQILISVDGKKTDCNIVASLFTMDGKLICKTKVETESISIPILSSYGRMFILMVRVGGISESWKIVI